jgi:hypothetical protein
VKSTLNLRPMYRQLFFDRGRELVPCFVQSLEEMGRTIGDPKEAARAWQRRWGLDGCDWIAESAKISLALWELAPGDRRVMYALEAAENPADYRLVIERPYFRTGDPENFRASVLQAVADDVDAFMKREHPEYEPVPAPSGNMLAGLDALVLRVCLGMSPAAILKRVFPGQLKRWEDVQRSLRRIARITDIRIPSAGRPKSAIKK